MFFFFFFFFFFTISATEDPGAPVISNCPDPIRITVPILQTSGTVTWTEPTASSSPGVDITVTQSHQPGDSFPVGTTTVTYTFTDMNGNQAVCTFAVTVCKLLHLFIMSFNLILITLKLIY